MVPVQNALDLPDTGVGLSVVMFFRLIGGAFGVALLTAISRRSERRRPLLAGLQHIVRSAFSRVYLWAAAISALTLIASFGLKEIPLRAA